MKSICIVFNKAPYGSQSSRELLDIALMAAAFEMPITAIFTDDGIYQLLLNQEPELLEIKNHSATFKAMELYGIENIVVNNDSLKNKGLEEKDLMPIAQLSDNKNISQLINRTNFVVML